ncbi:MAG TPA: hypothetical protein VH814_24980 [Steroidobacteraceae bacterium]|jgi:hypothetical protein
MHGRLQILLLVLALAVAAAAFDTSAAAGADPGTRVLYVIAHTGLQVSANDVQDIYLGEKELATGIKLEPMDNADAQPEFLAIVLKIDAKRYNALWTKKSFRDALNPPAIRGGDLDVLQAVKRTPGGIGYISSPPVGVTIVAKYPL